MASASLASPLTSPKKESSRGYFRRGTSVVAPNAVTTTARVAATRRVAPGAATAAPSSSRRLHGAGARRRVVARAEGEASRRISGAGVAGDGASDAVDRVHGARQSAQAKSLEARLAEVSAQTPWAGGAAAPPADRKGKDDWARWSETFDRVDGEEGILDALRGQLNAAVAEEDFKTAAEIKSTIATMRAADPVAAVENGYRRAVRDEDFTAAAKFRDAGAGMCGWWAGRGATEDEPGGAYGVMMRVAPEHGRYVGTSFSARELATMQERNARRARAGGSSDKTSDTTPTGDDDDAFGRRVFELWLERDETTGEYVARRAVRFDGVVAAGLGGEISSISAAADADETSTTDGGPVDPRGDAAPPARGFGADVAFSVEVPGGITPSMTAAGVAAAKATAAARAEATFASWTVENGIVRAPKTPGLTLPFEIDGCAMDELLSYEARGFMKELVASAPGFRENWERLKREHAARASANDGEGDDADADADDAKVASSGNVFEAFGGKHERTTSRGEPRDDYFFDKFVINETADAYEAMFLDDDDDDDDDDDVERTVLELEMELEIEMDDDDEDVDVLDAAARMMLSGRRATRGGFDDDDDEGDLDSGAAAAAARESLARRRGALMRGDGAAADGDGWDVEEARVPAEIELDGRHAFRLVSDVDPSSARGVGPLAGALGMGRPFSLPGPGTLGGMPLDGMALPRRGGPSNAADAATKADVEAAVLRGMADAKAQIAEELRDAANKAAIARGEPEIILLDLEEERERLRRAAEEKDADVDGDGAAAAAAARPDAPPTLDSDGVASRLGGARAGASPSAGAGAGAGAAGGDGTSLDAEIDRFLANKWENGHENAATAQQQQQARGTGSSSSSSSASSAASSASSTGGGGDARGYREMRDVSDAPPRGYIGPEGFAPIRDPSSSSSGDAGGRDAAPEPRADAAGSIPAASDASSFPIDPEDAEAIIEMMSRDLSGGMPLPLKTRFSRVPPLVASRSNADPFDRLYLGAFGPHGPEVLRLTRGRWGDELGEGDDCVTAVKLTGDANVPAGAASFRARVGAEHRLESSFSYPDELGVVARYKGQGRVAKPGFTERIWVDGELLLLDGRGGSLTGGAELGFVWAVPGERRLLILFSSLELPDAEPPVGMYLD